MNTILNTLFGVATVLPAWRGMETPKALDPRHRSGRRMTDGRISDSHRNQPAWLGDADARWGGWRPFGSLGHPRQNAAIP